MSNSYVKSHNEHGITTIEFFHPQSNSCLRKCWKSWHKKYILPERMMIPKLLFYEVRQMAHFVPAQVLMNLAAIKNEKKD